MNKSSTFTLPPKASLKTALTAVFNPMPFYIINQNLYPDIFSSSLLSFSAYVIHSPEFIKRVLQENYRNYTKGGKYGFIRLLLGQGLLTSDGEHWLRHRRIIQPSFHRGSLEYSRKVMIDETCKLVESLEGNSELNANHYMADLTVNIVGKAMFGLDSEDTIKILRSELDNCRRFGHSLLRMPIEYPEWILKLPIFKRLSTSINNVHSTIKTIIEDRAKSKSKEGDLLDLMIALRYEDTGEPMPVKQIQDELLTLIVAGHETTTLALSWTLYELAKNPLFQEKVRHEIKQIVNSVEELTFDKLNQLNYLGNVINESMRLYPPAYLFARTATEEDWLGPYYVPPGKNIVINLYGLHRNPAIWDTPDVYNPERFSGFDFSGKNRFNFLPFGGGPRGCIGTHFATAEMKIIISAILIKYNITPGNTRPVIPKPLFTLNPSEPIKVRLEQIT